MNHNVKQNQAKAFAVNHTMLFFAVILFAACMIGVPRFATAGNLMNIMIQVSINALIACGMTFVILSDGIDLSVGSVAAIAGVAGASAIKMMPNASVPVCLLVKKPTESFCRAANTLFLILQTTPGTMYAVIRP